VIGWGSGSHADFGGRETGVQILGSFCARLRCLVCRMDAGELEMIQVNPLAQCQPLKY